MRVFLCVLVVQSCCPDTRVDAICNRRVDSGLAGRFHNKGDFTFYKRVVESLCCRARSAIARNSSATERLPPEIREHGVVLRDSSDIERWTQYHRESWGAWHMYKIKHLQNLRSENVEVMRTIPERSDRVAVIVEARRHPDLEFSIRKTMRELGRGNWALVIIGTLANEHHIRYMARDWHFVHIHILDMWEMDHVGFNKILMSELYLNILEDIGCEIYLHFEADSVLLRPGVEAFTEYPMIGAALCTAFRTGEKFCCNGGISIRHLTFVRWMLGAMGASPDGSVEWCEKSFRKNLPEDYCIALGAANLPVSQKFKFRMPGIDVASAFSVESVYHPGPVAVHNAWKFHLPSDVRRILGVEGVASVQPSPDNN